MAGNASVVDYSALRFNQASIILLTLLGFVFDLPVLPAIVAAVMLGGTVTPYLALFKQTYRHIARPLKLIRPDPVEDSPEPHNFAQGMGGVVLALACALLFSGSSLGGWALAWVVVLLAAANLFFGFCAGCFIYFQLGKFGVPGFRPRQG